MPDSNTIGLASNSWLRYLALASTALGVSACTVDSGSSPDDESAAASVQALEQTPLADSCGYRVTANYHSRWRRDGYFGLLSLTNESGPVATEFEVFADLGGGSVSKCLLSECESVDGGYLFTAPDRGHFKIRSGHTHPIPFLSPSAYAGVTPYVISINGVRCDQVAPSVSLTASGTFFTSNGTLTLSAAASDNVAVRKVVFQRDGVVLATDHEAPYTLEQPIDASENGRHVYTAVAYDPSGNEATSQGVRVLTAVGNKFFGTAPDKAADYGHLLAHFDQLTPANAGKWGSVEATRDQMDWTDLDVAYAFAQANGLRFKLHTLVWGQQQPGWLAALTPEQQLAEIEQWMQLAAERYPNSHMVDVVNEPLHAVPSYSAALGGAGATGWDWVIKSFELARKYFPNAELLLNDYNIEAIDSATTDYLQIINLLNERGLIDGIGLQAHFLERAELPVIAANLDRLAATGLPIYIAELDVNFANDARQAQRMRDLFTTFWQHPSVVGVTHWGHLQGNTWRSDAYLVRSDGSSRPALDWIECFRGGGSDCPVPAYVPSPRVGDASGIVLQAEDYDDARGLVATGDVVAYTDNGDWESFSRVVFDAKWNSVSVTYAKGNQDPGSMSIHLGSLDSPAVVTIPLTNTGGWGTNKTVTVPFAPVSGERDVYVRYSGGYGIANVDRIAFNAPVNTRPNLMPNGSFETDTSGWFSWNGGTLSATTARAHSGSRSLLVGGRTGNAPAATNITSVVKPGTTYDVSFWVSIGNAATANVNVTRKIVCDGQTSYAWLVNPVAVADGQWAELKGSLTIPSCTNLSEVQIYAEGPPAGVDLYVDDVTLYAPVVTNLLSEGTFESSSSGWFTWGSGTLALTSTRANSGSRSLALTGRTGNSPMVRSLMGLVTPGKSYQVSLWASIGGAATANVNVTQKVGCAGSDSYSWLINPVAISNGGWVQLTGTLNVPNCTLTDLLLYAEGPGAGVDMYLDDVVVSP